MSIFEYPGIELRLCGRLKTRSGKAVTASPLSVGFETLDRKMFSPEKCYAAAGELGVKWARVQTGWNRCETVKGRYDFAWLDAVVDALLAQGMRPWFNLGYGNTLYMPNAPHPAAVGCIPHGYGQECLNAWKNFVTALTKRFAGRVNSFEIWNEPNIPCFWYPEQCSGKRYAELVALTAPLIKAANPAAETGGCTNAICCPFILEALGAGLGNHIDFFSVHPYFRVPEQDYFNDVVSLKNMFKRYAPHVKLFQGECGYPSTAHNNSSAWMGLFHNNENCQAHYVARRIVLDASAGFERISYFHIVDLMEGANVQADGKPRKPIMLGLLRGGSYAKKPSFYVLQNLAAIFDADCISADLWMNLDIKNYVPFISGAARLLATITGKFIRKGYPLYTWYYPEIIQHEWKGIGGIKVSGMQETPEKLGEPVVIDVQTGNAYETTNAQFTNYAFADHGDEMDAIDFTGNSFMIRGLPLTDYPLILTDKKAVDII